jgi:hypothetical protein
MPRAAVLSLHARVAGIAANAWEHPSFVQVWGPRYSVFVVPERDRAFFTLGRLPIDDAGKRRAETAAALLNDLLRDDERMTCGAAARALRVNHNWLRYGTTTGTMALRWDGARQPTIWMLPRPDIDPHEARVELARRYLRVYGPATVGTFSKWAGVTARAGAMTFEALRTSVIPVRTPIGDAVVLAEDEAAFREKPRGAAPARLLPSGDAYFLLHGADRALVLPDAKRRNALWTSRVWPGAVLVDGEFVGVWRRAGHEVTVEPFARLSAPARAAVEAEAATLPLPDLTRSIAVRWR